MISFLGLIIGLITLFVPTFFWPQTLPRLSGQDFIQQYPDKKRVYYVHLGLPIIWILLYMVIITPVLWTLGENSLYLISFAIGGGLSAIHSILEISTTVSMRNFSRSGSSVYLVDQIVKKLGWIRLCLVCALGIIPFLLVNLLL